MHIEINMQDLLKDLKEYTDLMEYLHFFYEAAVERYEIDLNEDYGINHMYREKFNKEPPEVK